MQDTFTVGEMAAKLHKSRRTLQQWDRDGKLVAHRTPTGRRFYTKQQLLEYFGESTDQAKKSIVVYCRVSSQAQKPDLLNQRKVLEDFCVAKGLAGVEFVEEVGSGMNFKRRKFRKLLEAVHAGDVGTVIVAHKDRLARFGFEHIEWECSNAGCQVLVLNNQQLSPEQEMVQDLMTIIHCFASRLYGLRNHKKSLKESLK